MSPYLCRLWRRKMLRQQHGTAAGGGGCRRQPKKAAVPPKKAHGVCRPGRDKLSEGKLQRRLSRRRDAAKRQELLRQQQKKAAVGGERSREAAKDLIGLVRSYHVCALIRGLENLEAPCKGTVFGTFCGVQKVPQKHARTCKKLPVASFCASETAETGRIANGREQGDHVSRRSRVATLWTPGDDSKLYRRRF